MVLRKSSAALATLNAEIKNNSFQMTFQQLMARKYKQQTPLSGVKILGRLIPLPLRFSSPLPFGPEDERQMPWLSSPTRTYQIFSEIGKGGRATAYRGIVINEEGERWPASPEIVIKIPNIDIGSDFTVAQIRDYLERQNRECGREWQLTRERLRSCRFANPLFDFTTAQVLFQDELLQVPMTAQLYLDAAKSLDAHLLRIKQRHEPYRSQQGMPVDNWNGMSSAKEWIKLARAIATGLADIHQRRVVHGDIWPPNIFVRVEKHQTPTPVFIDFGEAFPLEPKGESRNQRDHAYRAPERTDAQSIVTQQADVYSFGKLLLHLAMGAEPTLSPKIRGTSAARASDVR
jgi:serine/threonine protein kinase